MRTHYGCTNRKYCLAIQVSEYWTTSSRLVVGRRDSTSTFALSLKLCGDRISEQGYAVTFGLTLKITIIT
jgi:hypothetical protein